MRLGALSLVATLILASACSAPAPSPFDPPTNGGARRSNNATQSDSSATTDPPTSSTAPPTPTTPTPTGTDSDGDGFIDTEDCDPSSAAIAGMKLLDDPLATEKGFFTSADGFPQASWSYDGTAYRQTRILDAGDTAIFNKDPSISDVTVEITAASTEITTAITPTLRQMFIVLGASVTGGSLSAVGCGIEVISGQAVTQKTSIVRLDGPSANVTTTVLQRVDRGAVNVNEEFKIKARLSGGTLNCDVTIGGATTSASTTGLGLLKGAVGLYTKQTKALFKQGKICKMK